MLGSGSQEGYIIFLQYTACTRCPLIRQSSDIRRVVKTTLASETLALVDCDEAAIFVKQIPTSGTLCLPVSSYELLRRQLESF